MTNNYSGSELWLTPRELWVKDHPDPDLKDLLSRYIDVNNTCMVCHEMGLEPRYEWLRELLGR